jgi:phospholipase/carboxylesterase
MQLRTLIKNSTADFTVPMVLMHGYGSDERDMYGLAEELPNYLEVYCLRAPLHAGPGYAWFDIQWSPEGITFEQNQLNQSLQIIADFVAMLPSSPLIIGGFSQGAMMTLAMMHHFPQVFTHAVLLSGRGVDTVTPPFAGPVFHAHGQYDEVIELPFAQTLNQALLPLGTQYEYHEYQMGHTICMDELKDLNRWLNRSFIPN